MYLLFDLIPTSAFRYLSTYLLMASPRLELHHLHLGVYNSAGQLGISIDSADIATTQSLMDYQPVNVIQSWWQTVILRPKCIVTGCPRKEPR